MNYLGNFILGYNQLERKTIDIPAGAYSNGTIFKGTVASPTVVASTADIDNTVLGVLVVQPEGVETLAGDRIDLVCGTVRIDVQVYESARLDEVNTKGSSTMADLSALLADPIRNASTSGDGCILQLVQVVR